MTVQDIINYIEKSPYSINKAVIRGMLEDLAKDSEPVITAPQIETEELVVKRNGVFKAPEGKAYSKIIVNIKEEKAKEE